MLATDDKELKTLVQKCVEDIEDDESAPLDSEKMIQALNKLLLEPGPQNNELATVPSCTVSSSSME